MFCFRSLTNHGDNPLQLINFWHSSYQEWRSGLFWRILEKRAAWAELPSRVFPKSTVRKPLHSRRNTILAFWPAIAWWSKQQGRKVLIPSAKMFKNYIYYILTTYPEYLPANQGHIFTSITISWSQVVALLLGLVFSLIPGLVPFLSCNGPVLPGYPSLLLARTKDILEHRTNLKIFVELNSNFWIFNSLL